MKKNEIKLLMLTLVFMITSATIASETEKIKKERIKASELLSFMESMHTMYGEMGHIQNTNELLKIQEHFNISEEVAYLRMYQNKTDEYIVLTVLKNGDAIFFHQNFTGESSSEPCSCEAINPSKQYTLNPRTGNSCGFKCISIDPDPDPDPTPTPCSCDSDDLNYRYTPDPRTGDPCGFICIYYDPEPSDVE